MKTGNSFRGRVDSGGGNDQVTVMRGSFDIVLGDGDGDGDDVLRGAEAMALRDGLGIDILGFDIFGDDRVRNVEGDLPDFAERSVDDARGEDRVALPRTEAEKS